MMATDECRGINSKTGRLCRRLAVGTGVTGALLCRPHLTGEAQRAKRDQRRAEQRAFAARQAVLKRNQEHFVQAWRAAHPEASYTPGYTCPLCGFVVQTRLSDVGGGPFDQYGPSRMDREAHRLRHGDDWKAYETAGRWVEEEPPEATAE